jgi:acyl carrier protein
MSTLTDRSRLVADIIEVIVSAVNLKHLDRSTITESTSLTDGGLGLDSIDILEIIVALEQRFGVKIRDAETGRKVLRTIGTVADFVSSR